MTSNNENWFGLNIKGGSPKINNPIFINQPPPPQPPKYIPYQGVAHFVGRECELNTLHEKLKQPRLIAISAVAGMGGVGKTELVTRYARQHEAYYLGGICWINARNTNLGAEIVRFYQMHVDTSAKVPQNLDGKLLHPNEQAIWCWNHWKPSSGLVLVILDDVTDLRSCREVLPTNNRFNVLITTRLRNLDPNVVDEMSLNVLSPEDSLQLLKVLVGEKRIQREKQTAQELCQWLGYLPLGLDLVGRYISDSPGTSLTTILESLKTRRLEDESLEYSQSTLSTAQRGVKAAFELSWENLDLITQHVAMLLSLFAQDIIPWELVESAAQRLNWSEADVKKASCQLYKHNLIQWLEDKEDKEGYYKIHPLIREFLQAKLVVLASADKKQLYKHYFIKWLKDKERRHKIHHLIRKFLQAKLAVSISADDLKQAFAATMSGIARTIPPHPNHEFIDSVEYIIPHLIEVVQNLTDAVPDEDFIWIFAGLGFIYNSQSLYMLTEALCNQCLSETKIRFGENHPNVASSLNNLAAIYHYQERTKEAEILLLQALKLEKKLKRLDYYCTNITLNNLAEVYRTQKRYSEAEPLYQQALELQKRHWGDKHPKLSSTLSNLAGLYCDQQRYSEAEPLYLQALELSQSLEGGQHPTLVACMSDMAKLYSLQGRYSESENFYLQVLEKSDHILPKNHPFWSPILINLASLYISQERYIETKNMLQQALEKIEQNFGVNHPKTEDCRQRLTKVLNQINSNDS
ncbi:MAG: tetratricopeptide repeat protein [Calothrix sp. FI2-JRJ7]|jgi:tetratricopeptide (TPR) repeat protein|nr:tetratricopeptide repeat protein [Calothrix sp. FI2-JRJ7]